MTFLGTAFCSVCGTKVAEARGVLSSERVWHEQRAPMVFRCRKAEDHNHGAFGNLRFEWSEEGSS